MDNNVHFSDNIKLAFGYPYYFLEWYARITRKRFIPIMKVVRNWWSVLFVHLGLLKGAVIYFKNGKRFSLSRESFGDFMILAELEVLPEEVKKEYRFRMRNGKVFLDINKHRLKLDISVASQIAREFYYDYHSDITASGKDVIDIGAYVGDTALYYIINSKARHVYAFEPMPYVYSLGARTINENGLGRKITLINAAVSGKNGYAYVNQSDTSFSKVDEKNKVKKSKKVPVLSLDSIVKKYNIRHGALKVDCEGCEYSIFKYASSETIRRFDAIYIEYHYGYLDLVGRLREEGFNVSYKRPLLNFKGFSSRSMISGEITATKKGTR